MSIKTSTNPEQIAENIINLAKPTKTDENNVIISELTSRNDQSQRSK